MIWDAQSTNEELHIFTRPLSSCSYNVEWHYRVYKVVFEGDSPLVESGLYSKVFQNKFDNKINLSVAVY